MLWIYGHYYRFNSFSAGTVFKVFTYWYIPPSYHGAGPPKRKTKIISKILWIGPWSKCFLQISSFMVEVIQVNDSKNSDKHIGYVGSDCHKPTVRGLRLYQNFHFYTYIIAWYLSTQYITGYLTVIADTHSDVLIRTLYSKLMPSGGAAYHTPAQW